MSDNARESRGNDAGNGTAADIPALLDAASGGDEHAWRSIIDLYARRIYALARSRLSGSGGMGSDTMAEEITQSVFATLAQKLRPDADGQAGYTEQGKFEAWLFRVAMNRVRDELRRQRRHASPTDPGTLGEVVATRDEPQADQAEGTSRQLDTLRAAMAELGEADREVIELRHHAGLSFKQIAELLAEPVGTLLARHHRALRKLKELMTADPRFAELNIAGGDRS